MSENIEVHSDKHLQDLLEQSASDIGCYEEDREDRARGHNAVYPPNSTLLRPSKNIDVLKMGEGSDIDWEWHDEDCKGNNIRFINQIESQRIHTTEKAGAEIMTKNEENLEYYDHLGAEDTAPNGGELQQAIAYSGHDTDCANILDSLEMYDVRHSLESNNNGTVENVEHDFRVSDIIGGTKETASDNEERIQLETPREKETEETWQQAKFDVNAPIMNSTRLKAGFTYKEEEPKFIVRNKIELGKRTQGSYSQRFLERKMDGSSNPNKHMPVKEGRIHTRKSDRDDRNHVIFDQDKRDTQQSQQINVNSAVLMTGRIHEIGGSHMNDQPLEGLRHHSANIEIPVLEEMIREEEETLKNHIFDFSLPEVAATDFTGSTHDGLRLEKGVPQSDAKLTTKKLTGSQNQVAKTEHSAKCQTYAQLHSLTADKLNCKQSESPSSYVNQHIEKKKKHVSYKKYRLKDYAELNKEIVLQRSLGPDKLSEEYLEKVISCLYY